MEPFGPERIEHMLGMVCAVWAGKQPLDYIPDHDGSRKPKRMSGEAMAAVLMGLNANKEAQQARKRMNG